MKLRIESGMAQTRVGKIELATTGIKNELQRRLRKELQHQGIDIDSSEL